MASGNADTVMDSSDDPNPGSKRRDSKKRKFKPFSAVRKLFGGSKSKRKNIGDEENQAGPTAGDRPLSAPVGGSLGGGEEGLAGQRHTIMGGDRATPQLSMTSPNEDDVVVMRAKKPSPLSDANAPQPAFQAELTRKLSLRRSLGSEEEEEDDLRQEQAPSEASENDTVVEAVKDDLFDSRWSSSLASPTTKTDGSPAEPETLGSLDLSSMARTELLKSDAAKDRISVKRRTRRPVSRKGRERPHSFSLPSLKEAEAGGGGSSGGGGDGGASGGHRPTPRGNAGRPRSEYIDPRLLSDFDLPTIPSAVSAMELTGPRRTTTTTTTAATDTATITLNTTTTTTTTAATPSQSTSSTTITTTTTATAPTEDVANATEGDKPGADPAVDVKAKDTPLARRVSFALDNKPEPAQAATETETVTREIPSPPVTTTRLSEAKPPTTEVPGVTVTSAPDRATVVSPPSPPTSVAISSNEATTSIAISKGASAVPAPTPSDKKKEEAPQAGTDSAMTASMAASDGSSVVVVPPSASAEKKKKEGLRQTDTESGTAFAPKADYKLRRQQRSKTLPAQQTVITVQRTASQRGEAPPSQRVTKKEEKEEEGVSKGNEPEWVALARKKTQKHTEDSQQQHQQQSAPPGRRGSSEAISRVISTPPITTGIAAATTSTNVTAASSPTSKDLKEPNIVIMSATTAPSQKEAASQSQSGVKWNEKGGNVKPSPTSPIHLAHREGSVQTQTTKSQPTSTVVSSSASTPTHSADIPASSSSSAVKSAISINGETKAAKSITVIEEQDKKPHFTKNPATKFSSAPLPRSLTASKPTPSSTVAGSTHSVSRPVTVTTVKKVEIQPASSPQTNPAHGRPQSQAEKRSSSGPSWHTEGLQRTLVEAKEVKIELIETTPSNRGTARTGSKKADEPACKTGGDQRSDSFRSSVTTRRNSRVMALLKNFENLQTVS